MQFKIAKIQKFWVNRIYTNKEILYSS